MSRFIIIAILIIFIAGIVVNSVIVYKQKNGLQVELDKMKNKISDFEKENSELQAQVDYFSKPENLEKELRAMFNYKKPDEKMMIIVP